MGILSFLTRRSDEKHQLEIDFLREKNEIKLQAERDRRDLEISLKKKKQELDEKLLDYKIRDAEEKIKEDFEDYDDDDDETGSEEQQLLKMFAPAINGMMNKNTNSPQNTPPAIENPNNNITKATSQAGGVTFTDDEINEIYKSLPAVYKKVARGLSDDQIKNFIKSKYPQIADECLNRMIAKVKQ